jgi:hypothetical protein
MNLLERYLVEEHPLDQQDVADLENTLKSTVRLFGDSAYFDANLGWPYAVTVGKEAKALKLSQNTTAMIVNSLLRFRGKFTKQLFVGAYRKNVFEIPKAEDSCPDTIIDKALQTLLRGINVDGVFGTTSGTYGSNDVFTLAWLSELMAANWELVPGDAPENKVSIELWHKLGSDLRKVLGAKLGGKVSAKNLIAPPGGEALEHAFPVLRLVQAAKRLDITSDYKDFYSYFESSLHEQLSFSSIPDSRFDPAELMFCFEGMLLCQPSVDRTIFDRVMEVLKLAQNNSAFWRPVKPFLATQQGAVIFPVSVEIANSLMRSCVIVDKYIPFNTYGSQCVNLLRRYWQWLRARAVTSGDGLVNGFTGWHSEHVNEARTVHLWETSQVMDFLMSYRNMLHLHIARTTLTLSRFKVDYFPKGRAWAKIESSMEPVSSLGHSLKVYKRIGEDFVTSRGQTGVDNYSMLLYGPPGTGKSTVAKSIAEALGYRMITITVSDFLASGGAQLEARAKDIFTVLMAQPDCVVLFDEIDHFLLDRDSSIYSHQDTVFQFMTPGMLTKIADLRSGRTALFIIATNYEDRIDSAIKRTGRIDKKYLVLPPDREKRLSIIGEFLSKSKLGGAGKFSDLSDKQRAALADSSLFLGFTDIMGCVQAFNKSVRSSMTDLSEMLKDIAPTISLAAYQSRFGKKDDLLAIRETPMNEFLSLIRLSSQSPSFDLRPSKCALDIAAGVVLSAGMECEMNAKAVLNCDQFKMEESEAEVVAKIFKSAAS